MRILFVEDNAAYADAVTSQLKRLDSVDVVIVARSLASARSAFETTMFDVVLLDLSIPPEDGGADSEQEHGQTFFHEVRAAAPGTTTFILTSSDPDEFSRRLARFGEFCDVWGGGEPHNTVDYFLKEEAHKLIEELRTLCQRPKLTNAVTINSRGRDLQLNDYQSRILRVFCRKAGGSSVQVAPLSGGLSDARVFRATAEDNQRRTMARTVAKIGLQDDVLSEYKAFAEHVGRLKLGIYPPVFCLVDKGVGRNAGLFYTLAEDQKETLFDVAAKDAPAAGDVVPRLRKGMDRWIESRCMKMIPASSVRRRTLNDESFSQVRRQHDISFIDFVEEIEGSVACGTIHGDLHGGNILVDSIRNPILIDFGDVGPGYSTLDPITLELSFLYHPDGARMGFSQNLGKIIDAWPDVDEYARSVSFGNVITACREWAYDVGGGDLDVLIAGYAFAVRQLKYDTVDKEVTLRLLRSIGDKLQSIM